MINETAAALAQTEKRSRLPLSRWLLGSTALAGSAATATAETVQIDLLNNQATSNNGMITDDTYRDLTGDGIDDLIGSSGLSVSGKVKGDYGIGARVNGSRFNAGARITSSFFSNSTTTLPPILTSTLYFAAVGSNYSSSYGSPVGARNFIPITFTDARINGGAPTDGFIEVQAFNNSYTSHTVELVRLVFDDESTAAPSMIGLDDDYPHWVEEVVTPPAKPSKSAKKQLKKKIAALERKITTYKANSKANAPRLNFYGTQANRIRQIAALNRQLAALKRKLGRL